METPFRPPQKRITSQNCHFFYIIVFPFRSPANLYGGIQERPRRERFLSKSLPTRAQKSQRNPAETRARTFSIAMYQIFRPEGREGGSVAFFENACLKTKTSLERRRSHADQGTTHRCFTLSFFL